MAFSLLEVMITISIIAVTAGLIVSATSNSTVAVKNKKLEQDVAALNSAISIYKANGGKIVGSWKASKVLDELKTKADSTSNQKLAGLGGSMIDRRLTVIDESYSEAASGEPKALWDAVNQRFYVSTTNVRGIREFALSDQKADDETEERSRDVNLALNTRDGWIWSFVDQSGDSLSEPRTPSDGWDFGNGIEENTETGDPTLVPPVLSVAGGTYTLSDFDLELEISESNAPGTSQIVWSTDGGSWSPYTTPITVTPGTTTIYTYAAARNPQKWQDSEVAVHTYDYVPLELEAVVTLEKTSFTYMEMGGELMPGNYSVTTATPAHVTLVNSEQIPLDYQNSETFEIRWTFGSGNNGHGNNIDGVDVSNPGQGHGGPNGEVDPSGSVDDEIHSGGTFSFGFAGQDIPLDLSSFGDENKTTLEVSIVSLVDYVVTSTSVKKNLKINKTELRAPLATVSSGSQTGVGFEFVTDFGDMPVGAEIYYTTDGSNPTRDDNLYTAPIAVPPGTVVKAKVFPPDSYEHWFEDSDVTSAVVPGE